MTPAAFLQSYPEFADTQVNLVAAKLAQATARMGGPDFTVWPQFGSQSQPTLTDVAQGALCAHYLALSPFGTEMRLKTRQGTGDGVKTTYWTVWEECCDAVHGGFIVAGSVGFLPTPASPGSSQYIPGNGSVATVNGSANITFATVQSLPVGTIINFLAQPGVPYALASQIAGSVSGVLTAPYNGTSSAAAAWSYQLP